MKLLCPKCSSECNVLEQEQSSLTCPNCGLALFVSTSIRGRLSSTRLGQMDQLPEAFVPGDNARSPLPQTVIFSGGVSDQSPELALVPQFLGRYEVIEFLGSGSFSRVYLAKDSQLGRLVALKVLKTELFDKPEDLATFLREAQTIASLDHPGIVAVYDVVTESSGAQFIVMQYVKGMTLRDRLISRTTTFSEAANIVSQVAEAMHVAHTQNIFHRDLKPANILLDTAGRPHVADFGLAVLEHQQHQHAGELAGTLIYMAPEQIRREAQWLDGRSDIWSLGAIFYSLLTGRHPFVGKGEKTVSDEILYREPRPPRQINERIPKELERICLKCLSKPVRERYFSAFDLAEDLKLWLQTEASAQASSSESAKFSPDVQTAADSVRHPPPTTRARKIAKRIAGAAVLILVAIAAAHYSKPPPDDLPKVVKPNSPFDLDSYAVAGRWYPLLEQEPQLFAVTRREMSKWTHDAKSQELLIDVPTPLYLDLGETKSKRFVLEATIASRSWLGRIGLFWGRKAAPTEVATEGDQIQCHVVFLDAEEYRGKRESKLQRDLVKYLYNTATDTGMLHQSGVSSISIPWPAPSPVRLELHVNGDNLRVNWNGGFQRELLRETRIPGAPKLSPAGRFGVYAKGGTFQVSDIRIRLER